MWSTGSVGIEVAVVVVVVAEDSSYTEPGCTAGWAFGTVVDAESMHSVEDVLAGRSCTEFLHPDHDLELVLVPDRGSVNSNRY